MKLKRIAVLLYCLLSSIMPIYAWNAVGHQLIAQIAYDQLTPKAKRIYNRYNRAVNTVYPTKNWLDASVWLDKIRHQHMDQYNNMHYIDTYFSEDKTALPKSSEVNAVTAIIDSVQILKSNAREFKKGIALRILLHVVGDIHQPMHATSRVSQRHPDGDRGGQYMMLVKSPVAKNLHAYWDNGGGYLLKQTHHRYSIRQKAKQLEQAYPCTDFPLDINPTGWAQESHELGVKAYQRLYFHYPDLVYQINTILNVKKRIAFAGCRLGALLNQVASEPWM
jgi:hypothetical protein